MKDFMEGLRRLVVGFGVGVLLAGIGCYFLFLAH